MRDKDKYIPGEERADPPIGLYKIVKTGGGTPKIAFDDPYGEGKKQEAAGEEAPAEETAGQPPMEETAGQPPAEEKEIEFLRAERVALEQMIQAAAGPLWEEQEDDDEEDEREPESGRRKKEGRKPTIR